MNQQQAEAPMPRDATPVFVLSPIEEENLLLGRKTR